MGTLRTLLVLGRASNLPTVWSNCLAGWWLSGGSAVWMLGLICAGATCLYLGGMYLNDAFDAQFDLQHRPERPIPTGAIRIQVVWLMGFTWLALGVAALIPAGRVTIACGCLLAALILIYDGVHKIFAFSPVLMAGCRFLLILLAASTGREGITGLAIWTALVMAAYIIGLSYIARQESALVALRYWPCVLMAAPLVLAYIINRGDAQVRALALSGIIILWLLRSLSFALWSAQRHVSRCVSSLLAGIPLMDLLSVWTGHPLMAALFVALFFLALLFQRFIPAT